MVWLARAELGRDLHPRLQKGSGEFGGSSESVEGGNGFDEAGDGKGVADASWLANEMKRSALASERNGNAHQRGDAGAVDLRDAVQIDNDLAAGFVKEGVQRRRELIAGLADG